MRPTHERSDARELGAAELARAARWVVVGLGMLTWLLCLPRLTTLAGKKLDKFDLGNATQAEMAVQAINSRDLVVTSVEREGLADGVSAKREAGDAP